jgi:DNA-binding XRE family transcriptional regulator
MPHINPKIIDIGGAEMVLLTRAEYDALVEAAADADEDAADLAIYDARKAELASGGDLRLSAEVSARMLKGERLLRALRNCRGLTQLQLATATGFGQGYLSDLEAGHRKGTAETMHKIAAALDVDPVWLIQGLD